MFVFGAFCLDPARRLLLRDGAPVAITPKTFDTLHILIENRHRVVAKEDLIRQVWPDTVVEEASLSQQIFLLRKALGDESAEYIATIPRRGFRFTAPVVERTEPVAAAIPRRHTWGYSLAAVGAILAIVVATVLFFAFRSRRAPALTDRDQLVLADFANSTGDPIFDGTLTQGMAAILDQSPFLSVVSSGRVRETLEYMNRVPDARLDRAVAREVCQRLGAKTMLGGSIASLGTHYVIGLEATDCESGETLGREQEEVRSREDVLNGLGRGASRMRARLGESLRSVQRYNVPLTQATTSSLEALKTFSAGEERRAQGLELEAIPFYERAIALDADFALAYARLTAIYGNVGEWGRGAAYAKEAFARQGRVSDREKFYIASGYYITADANIDKYRETLELWAAAYPRDWYPLFAIADSFNTSGQYARGIEPARQALRLNPHDALAYERVAETYQGLNDWASAKAVLESAIAARRDGIGVHQQLFEIAVVEGDEAAAARHASFAEGKQDEESMLDTQADAAAFAGKIAKSRAMRSREIDLLVKQQFVDSAAITVSNQAVIESLCGDGRHARDWIARALRLADAGIPQLNVIEALANLGDVRRAEHVARKPWPSPRIGGWLQPGVVASQAMLQIQRGQPSSAIETLRPLLSLDLGRYALFRPPYVRGLAYLALKDGRAAAAEFQKILDHRGVAPLSMLYPLALLQQGRAFVLAGDTSKARSVYEAFLTIWKDADSDVPILQDARREYRQLD